VTSEPTVKRAVAFVDGQNLFHAAREAFGYTYPNYNVLALVQRICALRDWTPVGTRFYTGIPDADDDAFWHDFWASKLLAISRQGAHVFSRPLRYRNRSVRLPDGSRHTFLAGEEKGIDVRIALDIIRLAHRDAYDVAVVFSQDQDLSEVAEEIRVIARGSRSRARFPRARRAGTAEASTGRTGSASIGQHTRRAWTSATTGGILQLDPEGAGESMAMGQVAT
jgi:uncharacterized LabA/DUF88 family protein